MQIPLDRQAEQPIYLQIRDRIRRLISSGALQPGDRLPSVRELAKEAAVNKLTVIEAYSVLEADGLIHARQGSGYFVNCCPEIPLNLVSSFAPAQRVVIPPPQYGTFCKSYMTSFEAQRQPGILDFSSGFPQAFGLEDLQRIARRAMSQIADTLYQYDTPRGLQTLRQQIAQLLVQRGLIVSADNLMITTGSMQGISLALRYFVQPGDWVIVETPCYHGALSILENLRARTIGIPLTPAGMNLELLEQYLKSHRPKLIYTVSTLHNPTGITTSLAHRKQLLALAQQYDCFILEDNAYEGLQFEPVPPPIKALDQQNRVIYVSTFSKTLMGSLRVGYMVVTGEHLQPLIEQKLINDLHTPTPSQAIVSEYLASGHYRHRLRDLQTYHLQSRNQMLQALEDHFPAEVTWTVPIGGLLLWVQLPDRLPLEQICHTLREQGILTTPATAFFPDRKGYNAMRLNFSHPPESIAWGIAAIGKELKSH
ncbi:PLP-dependent aminotransferase family protein [Leptolyngbya sp. FACHB-711]|uniref:aminotransferase-like domain-containing protein n=1 Tax=Leptolyngbya sp. FACHB-711 TaxID=2692813 RepID=UPI001687D655|nr:PLP-dependent aminotransferase family protein [Leptolyngbya sp. FACHB-711]MBD2026166.1 PLP-dependent aminotransferase family protein [Leptolyngbya sp. FACHB-711]